MTLPKGYSNAHCPSSRNRERRRVTPPDPASVVDAPSGTASGSPPETTTDNGGNYISRLRSATRSTHWRRIASSDLFFGMVLAVLAWPSSTHKLLPVSDFDGWPTTLAMAAHIGMPFGTHILFTYGPLGFLTVQQLDYSSTAILAFVFTLAISTAVFGALIWSLRRAVPLVLAVMVSYIVGAVSLHTSDGPEYVLALVLVVCIALLSRVDEEPAPLGIWLGLGGVFSVFSLVKVSLGVGIAAALIVTVVCMPIGRRRAVGALVIGSTATFCVCWFGTGNGFGNIISFAKGSVAVISGYPAAMSIEVPTRLINYGLAVLVMVLVGAFALAHAHGLPRRTTIGVGLVTLVIVWLLFKEGFVRHDTPHDVIFFAAAPLVLAAFLPWRHSWALVPGVLILTVVTCIVAGGLPSLVTRPNVAVRTFISEATTLASSGRSAGVIDQSRRWVRDIYGIPNGMVAMMRGQTVGVSPWEQPVVWAYPQFHFDPLPVITDYNAYTPYLDQLDASYLGSPDAPHFILRQTMAIDGRNPAFEPPTTQLAIECRYRQVAVAGTSWQLLERGADRCGPLRHLGTVTTGSDRWVAVPTAPAGHAIVARFQLSQGWFSKLQAIAFKPPIVVMEHDDGQQYWRFVAATAPDLHVLHPASTLGYSLPFVPVSVARLRFVNGLAGDLSVSFYDVPLVGRTG
jgi:hypothetical protein